MAKKRRSRGSGSIYRHHNGTYYFQWLDHNGLKRVKSLRTRDRKEALENAVNFEKAVAAQDQHEVLHQAARARGIIQSHDLPLSEVWTAYLATRPTCSAGTLGNHKRNLGRFNEWLKERGAGIESFTQVTADIAGDYLDDLWGTGISAATFNYHRASLQAITNALPRKYGIEGNPWHDQDRKNDEHQTRQTMAAPKIVELLGNAGTDPELHTLLMLGAYAGMRLKDAALLKWHDVDMQRRMISYRPYKTRRRNKTAIVPITDELHRALSGMTPGAGGYVLPGIAGEYTDHYDRLKKSLLEVVRTVQPDHDHEGAMQRLQTRTATGFHALRHYFCSTCANSGIPAAQLERMTADQAKTLNQYYIHGEIDAGAVAAALTPLCAIDPAREQLKMLADSLPLDAVKSILAKIKK